MLAVIDTNVLFEGLTKQGGASRLVIEAWLAGEFRPCVSTASALEYQSVLTRKLAPERLLRLEIVLSALLDQAKHIEIHFSWRPSSTDPGDDMVVDCTINVGPVLVTWNLADFALPAQLFGLHVLTPVEFVSRLHHSIS